ncbi:MAG: hypothetical protein H6Q37_381 [Chloroflexi bacterium]|nr:hypothetical protein [Chloroflexota bacterium]
MASKSSRFTSAILLLFAIYLTGCTGLNGANASKAVEGYLKALVAKDTNQVVNASCAAWEASARQELRTFDAVTVSLDKLSCNESGNEGEFALVACTGKIVANYGNEVLEINLNDRIYKAIEESGEWRMCGYQQ